MIEPRRTPRTLTAGGHRILTCAQRSAVATRAFSNGKEGVRPKHLTFKQPLNPNGGDNTILLDAVKLNPTPNDRNVEFDPKRNLFTDLKPVERVTDP